MLTLNTFISSLPFLLILGGWSLYMAKTKTETYQFLDDSKLTNE